MLLLFMIFMRLYFAVSFCTCATKNSVKDCRQGGGLLNNLLD